MNTSAGKELRLGNFSFTQDNELRLHEKIWSHYTTDEYFRFYQLRELIKDFICDLAFSVKTTSCIANITPTGVMERYVLIDPTLNIAFSLGNHYSPVVKFLGKHKVDNQFVATKLLDYRHLAQRQRDARLDYVLRGLQKLMLNLPNNTKALFAPDPEARAFLVQVVWNDWINRDVLSFRLANTNKRVY